MRNVYFLMVGLFMAFGVKAQSPIIAGIMDASCSGGTPKLLVIYVNGTVDLSNYSVQNQTNANTTWGSTLSLADFGTVTDSFIYITESSSTGSIAAEFPSTIDIANGGDPALGDNIDVSGVMNINGDDRIRIVDNSMNVIDQYGVSDTDGTGTTWEYMDSYAIRSNGTGPDGGFAESNWTIFGTNTLDGQGVCNSASTLESITGFENFMAPTLSVNDISSSSKDIKIATTANTLVIHGMEAKSVEIYDINGRLVGNSTNLSGLSRGVYIARIVDANGQTVSKKFVK